MLVTIVPVLVLIVGLLVYALAANPKVVELGRIAYFVGLLVTVWAVASRVFRL